jgi:hypothetical protein
MLDAATQTTTQQPHVAFAFHPEDSQGVILVTEGQRGFQRITTRLSPRLLNELLFDPAPSWREVDEMVAYAFNAEDRPDLTDIDVRAGWPA